MKQYRLSIITPCYNSAGTIKNTLESVLNQHYDNMEHIVIDGGSTDGTLKILDEYKARADYEVKIVSEPDNGIYDAMNKGIRMASGDLVGIINSDDWYEAGAFDKITGAYSGAPLEVIYGAIRLYEEDKLKSAEFYHHDFLLQRMINHPGCFVTGKTYAEVGLFDTAFRSSADYDWMKRAYDAGAVFTPIESVLANIRAGGMSASNVGFRETLKLQYKWGQISGFKYAAYSFKSRIGDLIRKIKR